MADTLPEKDESDATHIDVVFNEAGRTVMPYSLAEEKIAVRKLDLHIVPMCAQWL